MKRPTLILFDAHAILHRAFHALPDFATAKGEPTGALYGLATLLMKTIDTFHPEQMIACYDLPKPTFRDKIYSAYKGKRPEIDDALIRQIERSREIFSAFDIPVLAEEGFEADDIIGTVAERAKSTHDILIVTGDMDTLQLVDDARVRVFTLKKGIGDTIIYDEDAVKERYGFGPELVADYKGLRGDPSDNIIGIPGIGEKTATTLITAFGSIDDIYARLKKKGADEAFKEKGVTARIVGLLRDHEEDARFSKMLATIRKDAPVSIDLERDGHEQRFDRERAKALFTELEFRSLVVRLGGTPPSKEEVVEEIAIPDDIWERAKIAIWLLDSDKTSPEKEDLVSEAGNTPEEKLRSLEKRIVNEGLERVYREIELPLVPIIARAMKKGILVDTKHLEGLSSEYHTELDRAVKEVHRHAGVEFNINSPKQLGEVLFDRLGLTAKGLKKTEGGARSTRESELEKLRESHPIVDAVLRYREYQKLLSTYIDVIPTLVDENDRLHTTLHQTGTTTGRISSSDPNLQNIPVREGIGERIRDAFVAPPGKTLIAFDYSQIEMRVLAILSKDPGLIEIFRSGEDVHTSVASRVFAVKPEDVTRDMRRRAKVINFGIIYGMGVSALQRSLGSTRADAQAFYDDYLAAFPKAAAYMEETIRTAAKRRYTTTLFGRRRQVKDIASKVPYVKAAAERAAMNAPIQGTAADIIKLAMIRVDAALAKSGLSTDVELLLQVHDELIYEATDRADIVAKASETIAYEMEHVLPEPGIPLLVAVKEGRRWGKMRERR